MFRFGIKTALFSAVTFAFQQGLLFHLKGVNDHMLYVFAGGAKEI